MKEIYVKKFITFMLIIGLTLTSLTGCGSKQISEEEMKAELKARMENETDISLETQTASANQGASEQSDPGSYKTFEDVYDGTHLTPVIAYFDENYGGFSEDKGKEFAQKIVDKCGNRWFRFMNPSL